MAGIGYAFFGIAYFGSFFFIQLVMNRLLRDPTNIEFKKSMALASASSLLFGFGLRVVGTPFSLSGLILIVASILVLWKLSENLYGFGWWEGLQAGIAASIFFPLLYLGSAWVWGRIFQFP